MNDERGFDRALTRLMDGGSDVTPPEVIDAVLLAARSTPQERDLWISWRNLTMRRAAYGVAAVTALAVGVTALASISPIFNLGSRPTSPEERSADLGIFEEVAGWIVYGDEGGMWGVDPDSRQRVQLTSEAGTPLGWSSDGTHLLFQKGDENLFVLHADGSETQVTEQLSGFNEIPGSARPTGATISPDGSRVVFAGLTESWEDGNSCHNGALFAVDADGGQSEVLWESQRDGIVRDPTFSPDGTQIAFVDGYCDSDHSVWVMNADGSDARQIVSSETDPLGATWVYGLAWSPAGDRIALGLESTIYTFAPDGSGFMRVQAGKWPYWSPDGSEIRIGPRAWHPGALENGDGG